MPVSASIRQTASMTLERKEEKLNKNEKKQRQKLLQNKESLKRQKEDLRNIRKTQNKINREKSKAKLKHGAREKGDEKRSSPFFRPRKKEKRQYRNPYPI